MSRRLRLAVESEAVPLVVLTAIAAVLTVAGGISFRRRDLDLS